LPDPLVVPPDEDEPEAVEPAAELADELLMEPVLELLDDAPEPPDEELALLPEDFVPPADADFELPLDFDLLPLFVLLLAVVPLLAFAFPEVLFPFAPPCPPVVDPLPPWVEPDVPLVPLVPLRLVPLVPPAPIVPPTVPMRASTSHRTTVLLALSSVPFSTTYSVTSP
jgi:hypothetical protein